VEEKDPAPLKNLCFTKFSGQKRLPRKKKIKNAKELGGPGRVKGCVGKKAIRPSR